MSHPNHIVPDPTVDLVQLYIKRFDQEQAVVETALHKLFTAFPSNKAFDEVLLKVVALNDLYRTNIFATYQVAKHIVMLDIDKRLYQGDLDIVQSIARTPIGNKTRNNYSFATKYCAWHDPERYAIYDSYVDEMLWFYRKRDHFDAFFRCELLEYKIFIRAIEAFRIRYALQRYSIRDIDKFLWLMGQEFFSKVWGIEKRDA